jgi:FAD/FMN-containing dehydrogenase
MWTIREHLPEGNRRTGSVSSHDIALPIGRISEFLAQADGRVATVDPALRVNCFGHMGDGNLHYNVFPPDGRRHHDYDNVRGRVRETIHDLVHALDGSVSAEHGIGRLKTADLVKYGDPAKIAAMRAIKAALDPYGIMNPGAVLA